MTQPKGRFQLQNAASRFPYPFFRKFAGLDGSHDTGKVGIRIGK